MEQINVVEVTISPSTEVNVIQNEAIIQVDIEEGATIETVLTVSPQFNFEIHSGARGKSAYEFWLSRGNEGSPEDFFNTLKGPRGEPFRYEDFTPEQLELLIGPPGTQGEQGIQGERGAQGEQGIQGIQGEQGLSAYQIWLQNGNIGTEQDYLASLKVNSYTHYQISASQEWMINHNIGKFPSVSVVDSAGTVVIGDVTYIDMNNLIIQFISAFSGKAYLN